MTINQSLQYVIAIEITRPLQQLNKNIIKRNDHLDQHGSISDNSQLQNCHINPNGYINKTLGKNKSN